MELLSEFRVLFSAEANNKKLKATIEMDIKIFHFSKPPDNLLIFMIIIIFCPKNGQKAVFLIFICVSHSLLTLACETEVEVFEVVRVR